MWVRPASVLVLLFCLTVAADEGTATLDRLLDHPRVLRALGYIESHTQRGRDELVELNEIPAPPFEEGPRGQRYAEMLKSTGFGEVTIDEVGNVIARREGVSRARTVAVLAHLDTVFPADTDVSVAVDGDTFSAPGVGDNTRGLVLLLDVARAVVAADLSFEADVMLVGNVGEEGLGDLRGVRHLFRNGAPPINALIAIDGGAPGRLVDQAVGSNRFRVTFSGAGGHSWGDFGHASPHHALGTAIDLLHTRAGPVTREGPRASFNVGRIGGGTSVNSIAFESWMEVDLRSADPEKLAELTEVFEGAMRDALVWHNMDRRSGPSLTLALKPIGQRPAGRTDPEAPLLLAAEAALRHVGYTVQRIASSTDANVPMSLGVPAVTISRGGISGRAHSLEEFWIDKDTYRSTQAALLTLAAAAGTGGP
ncbi:MAG: M20/M25/M40 family metallo-hydrolase [Pseudomonadota bacterium]